MNLYQTIFEIIAPSLPEDWIWLKLHHMYGENRTRQLLIYGRTQDRKNAENVNLQSTVEDVQLDTTMDLLRDEITPKPLEQFTHIELLFERDGQFDSVLGYGEPNWDLMAGWPDDITAQDYTYVNSFPNGVNKGTSLVMKDPRTMIGVKIRDE